MEVSGGGIDLGLPKSAALDLDARASGGEVLSDFPLNTPVRGSTRPGALQTKLNGGGPALVLRASSGNIHLHAPGDIAAEQENSK